MLLKIKKKKLEDEKIDNSSLASDKTDDAEGERELYFIVDKQIPGMLGYLRDCGLGVKEVFTSVEAARSTLITQFEPARVVIVDSGTGLFITPNIRREIIDMIGMANKESKFTVFFSDSLLESSGKNQLSNLIKQEYIEYIPYNSMAICVAVMAAHKEVYRCSGNDKTQGRNEIKARTDILGEKIVYTSKKITGHEIGIGFFDDMHASSMEGLMEFSIRL